MDANIYYFSATGNSLVAARNIAKELGGCQLIPIVKALKEKQEITAEIAGIVFPVYMFGLPLIVAEFLRKIKVNPDTYIFTMATLGGASGRCHSQASQILKKRGIDLSSGFSVVMPGNYTPLYGAIPKEAQEKIFAAEKVRIKEIAGFIRQKKRGIMEQKPFLFNLLLYKLIYKAGSRQIPTSGKFFWADDKCIKCGLCAKICPVDNIEMRDGKPGWLNHCQHCMACLQWCPVEAIQYKQSTQGRKRYHHPDIKPEEIAAQKV